MKETTVDGKRLLPSAEEDLVLAKQNKQNKLQKEVIERC